MLCSATLCYQSRSFLFNQKQSDYVALIKPTRLCFKTKNKAHQTFSFSLLTVPTITNSCLVKINTKSKYSGCFSDICLFLYRYYIKSLNQTRDADRLKQVLFCSYNDKMITFVNGVWMIWRETKRILLHLKGFSLERSFP